MLRSLDSDLDSSGFDDAVMTRGEELVSFLQRLGYSIKFHKPEHFEYLFQNEKSARLCRLMMDRIKLSNELTDDEISKLKKLKAEGILLKGEALKKAVQAQKARDQEIAMKSSEISEKSQEINKKIAVIRKEIENLETLKEIMQSSTAVFDYIRGKEAESAKKMMTNSEDLDNRISFEFNILSCNLSKIHDLCKEYLNSIRQSKGQTSEESLSSSFDEIIRKEDILIDSIQGLTTALDVSSLSSSSSDYDSFDSMGKRSYDEQKLENLKIELERLKNSIIFEKVLETELMIEDYVAKKMDQDSVHHCLNHAKRWKSFNDDHHSKLVKDCREKVKMLEVTYHKEGNKLLENVKKNINESIVESFKQLETVGSKVNEKLNNHLLTLLGILAAQKVRMHITKSILICSIKLKVVAIEGINQLVIVLKKLQNQPLLKDQIMEDREAFMKYAPLLRAHGIPTAALSSFPALCESLLKIWKDRFFNNYHEIDEKLNQQEEEFSEIQRVRIMCSKLYDTYLKDFIESKDIDRRLKHIETQKRDLEEMEGTSSCRISETTEKYSRQLQLMKKVLDSDKTSN